MTDKCHILLLAKKYGYIFFNGIIISVFSFTENLCFLNFPGIPLPS